MAGFGGAVAKDAVIHQGRVQAGGHQEMPWFMPWRLPRF